VFIEGPRKKKEANKGEAKTIGDFLDDDGTDDNDFEPGADESIAEDIESEDEEVVGEEEATEMPAKKAPAKKKSTTTDDLSEDVAKMSLRLAVSDFSMDFRCPFIMFQYTKHGRKIVTVNFFIPTVHKRHVRVKIGTDQASVELRLVVPPLFYNPDRQLFANADDDGFNHDTHKATAFQEVVQEIEQTANDVDEVMGTPQIVKLPFTVEADFWKPSYEDEGWEIELHDNDDRELEKDIGGTADLFILTVDCVSIEKPKTKSKGKMRKIVSPYKDDEKKAETMDDEL
jgi:hypothetical protein